MKIEKEKIRKPRHKNIPFFIPHEGCPHDCVFCSQDKITGFSRCERDIEDEVLSLEKLVEDYQKAANEPEETELAFFGGSFTAIERNRMIRLLETGKKYIDQGLVSGIRLSTRPDAIDEEILDILKAYGVTAVELGVQSTDDGVLDKSGRGHTSEDSRRACALVKKYGFECGGQMMVGLPGSDGEKEVKTAEDIVKFGCDSTRIYPTVVFANTKLYDLALENKYIPLDNGQAAKRCADCLEVFDENGVKVLKIGLHSSEELAKAPFGANHPAIGEMTESVLLLKKIERALFDRETDKKRLEIYVPAGFESKAAGHKRANIEYLENKYGFKKVSVYKAENLPGAGKYKVITKIED